MLPFQTSIRDSGSARGITGFGGLKTALGNGEGRPMTGVRAAGYSSRGRTPGPAGQGSFDPFVSPSNHPII